MRREISYLKPVKFKHFLTIKEVSEHVGRDISRIRRLEADGRIPKAIRVKRGELEIRLWSPDQADEIREIFEGLKPGRPRNDGN